MKAVIVGTAGHVDHGKTALIEALTGTNTDRWEEERRRGITIDLGFASFPTGDDDLEVSVVDVPGHEDFVRNMLAGATGVDLLLLVVAADEGPMPQTREHLWIAHLLGVERGVVALSKADLVEGEWCDLVRESLADELDQVMGVSDWPVITVSAIDGSGLEELRSAILQSARSLIARREDDLLRIPVDRSFTVRGVGTVVTGTIWSGTVSSADEVLILPEDRRARIRGVQVHGRDVETASAGQRAALALAGVDRSEVGRGSVLVADEVWRTTRFVDARLRLLPDSPWPLKHWQRVHLHLGTAETLARVVLHDGEPLSPGSSALVQLRLEQPLVARAGDRFVIRFYSPVTTIGGGVILDPWAPRRGRLSTADAHRLEAQAEAAARDRVLGVVTRSDDGVTEAELRVLTGARPSEVREELGRLAAESEVREAEGRWFAERVIVEAKEAVLRELAAGHARDTGAAGLSLESLRSAAGQRGALVDAALAELELEGQVRVEGSLAALVGHEPRLLAAQEELAGKIQRRLRQAGLTPPTVKELASESRVPEEDLLAVLKFMTRAGELVAVTADLYCHSGAIKELRARVGEMLRDGGAATPSEFRQALGVSRKYLIPLLEHLDAVGVTRRTPEGRVLRGG